MKLIYLYRKLRINVFLVNVRVVKDFIYIYIYIFLAVGRGVQGDKTNPLVTQSMKILCVFNKKRNGNKVASTR